MKEITIGNTKCTTRIVNRKGVCHGELLINGKQFDVTATCGDNEERAEKLLEGMVAMYRKVLKQQSAFGAYAREKFLKSLF